MKTANRITSLIVGVVLVAARALSEGFINLPGETNVISIATNEAIVLTAVRDAGVLWPNYTLDGETRTVGWRKGTILLGPGEVITTNKCVVSYARFSAPHLRMLVWQNWCTNNIIHHVSIPAGKTFRLLGSLDNATVDVYGARPGNTNFVNLLSSVIIGPPVDPMEALDLPGPIELELSTPSCSSYRFYYFLEDAPEPTTEGYILGPTGTYEVAVEKSLDLKQWTPVMVRSTESSDARAFYRLRMLR